jgi:hypothetical protein
MGTQQMINAAVLHGIGQAPRYEPFPAPVATAADDRLLQQVAAGEIGLDIGPVPLAKVGQAWPHAGSDRRTVFVP